MDRTFETRPLSIVVKPVGEPIFSEYATMIEIADDGTGEFIVIKQVGGRVVKESGTNEVRLDPDEWIAVRDAINAQFLQIKRYEKKA